MNVILFTFKSYNRATILAIILYLFAFFIYDFYFQKLLFTQETIIAKVDFSKHYKDISLPPIFRNSDFSTIQTFNEFRRFLILKLNSNCKTNIEGAQANDLLSNHVKISKESLDYYKVYSFSNDREQSECINETTLIAMNEFLHLLVSNYNQNSTSNVLRAEKFLDKTLNNSSSIKGINIGYANIINNQIYNLYYLETLKINTNLNLKYLSLSMNSANPEFKYYQSIQDVLAEINIFNKDISKNSSLDLSYIHSKYAQELDFYNNLSLIQYNRNAPNIYLLKFLVFDSRIINEMNTIKFLSYLLVSFISSLTTILIYRIIIVNLIINKSKRI
jgi:hypothetical protein